MPIQGNLKLNIRVNPGYIDNQIAKSGFYDAFTDELLDLAQEFQENSPIGATEQLISGWDVQSTPRKIPYGFEVRSNITNNSDRAENRIAGREPGGMPPIGNLENPESGILPWVVAKGIETNPKKARSVAYAIAMSIKERGTQRYRDQDNWVGIDHHGKRIPGGRLEQAELAIADKLTRFNRR